MAETGGVEGPFPVKPALHRVWTAGERGPEAIAGRFPNPIILAWVSSNTESTARGSVMMYFHSTDAWYLGFEHTERWRLIDRRGIGEAELRSLKGTAHIDEL